MSGLRKKIALVSSSESWGGLEMNLLRIAEVLKENHHNILLYLIENSEIWNKAKEAGFELRAMEGHRKYYDFGKARQLARQFKEDQIHSVLFRDNFDMSLLVSTKYLMGKNIKLVYFQGMQLGIAKRGLLHTLRFRALDAWLTPLQFLANQAIELTRIRPDKVHVVPLGRDFRFQKNAEKRMESRITYGIPEDIFLAGILGRLDPAKGHELLLRSLEFVKDTSIHVLFQGEATKGEHEGFTLHLQQISKDLKIADRVHFADFNPDPSGFFNAVDLFVMASKQETFGMATIEALSAGVPVLGSDAGGTPEILLHGACGTLFKTMDAGDLAQKLTEIVANPEIIKTKVERGTVRSREFSTASMYQKLQLHL
jgi:glycosyltransferase involved in cell wall biosynthesis